MLDEGVSLVDAIGGTKEGWQQPDWWLWREDHKSLMPAGPKERFYNDITDSKTLNDLVKGLRPQAAGSFYSKNSYTAWKDVPTTYIACERDRAIPIEGQKAMIASANAAIEEEGRKGRAVKEVVLDSSHSPMVKMPESLAEEIRKALETS